MAALTVLRLWELYREVTLGYGEERTCPSRRNSLSSRGSLAARAGGCGGGGHLGKIRGEGKVAMEDRLCPRLSLVEME